MPLRLVTSNSPAPFMTVGLHRRRSSRRAPTWQKDLSQNTHHIHCSFCYVPTELLERIIRFFIGNIMHLLEGSLETQKSLFRSYLHPSTLVSRDFRFLALREFFCHLDCKNVGIAKALFDYLSVINIGYLTQGWNPVYLWVRSISSSSFVIPPYHQTLQLLTNITCLRLDFSHSGLLLQHSCVDELLAAVKTTHFAANLTSLTFLNIPRIDSHLLTSISMTFPGLIELDVNASMGIDLSCCPGCYEESLSRIIHSPIPDIYHDITFLAKTFGDALAPLKKLTRLYLGIYLSPTNLLDWHLMHSERIRDLDIGFNTLESIHLCSPCDEYKSKTKERELIATALLSRYLDSIKTIGWSSCYKKSDNDNENRLESSTSGEINIFYNKEEKEKEPSPILEPSKSVKDDYTNQQQFQLRTDFEIHKQPTKITVGRIS